MLFAFSSFSSFSDETCARVIRHTCASRVAPLNVQRAPARDRYVVTIASTRSLFDVVLDDAVNDARLPAGAVSAADDDGGKVELVDVLVVTLVKVDVFNTFALAHTARPM